MILERRDGRSHTKFYAPRKPCQTCGTRKRYQSTRHCVECKRRYDLEREGDRRSIRAKALSRLERREGVVLRELPKVLQDAFLRANYPNMEVK